MARRNTLQGLESLRPRMNDIQQFQRYPSFLTRIGISSYMLEIASVDKFSKKVLKKILSKI